MTSRVVYGLVGDINFATKIAKTAKEFSLSVCNSDKAESLLKLAKERTPKFVILDLEKCEREAFLLLKKFREDEILNKIPVIGCLFGNGVMAKDEAQRAGCAKVYMKTELNREWEYIWTRYGI